jgi:hypothetical protein
MPDRNQLNLILGSQPEDIRKVRLPGLEKPFEQLTIGELVQLRAGAEVASSYSVEAVGSDATVTTSSMLAELGKIHSVEAMQNLVHQERLNDLRTTLAPEIMTNIGGLSAQDAGPQPSSVRLPRPEDDIFRVPRPGEDPFKL